MSSLDDPLARGVPSSDPDATAYHPSSDPHATEYFDHSVETAGAYATAFSPSFVLNRKFRLEKQLGRGGMGEAWKAFDTLAERDVVLKFVPKEIQHVKEAMDSVKDSFKKVHALQHQHICPVYDLFQDAQHGLCLVMKFIDGLSLDEYRRKLIEKNKTLSFSDLVQILWDVAQGLDYAHEKRVIHRDIKPQNIMVGKTDGVQVIDFGLAEEIRTSMVKFSEVTMNIAGTRPYMAPEQWQGKYQDAKTDQYALAVTAYELLSGRFPFQGTDIGVLRECVLHDTPDPIPKLPDYINGALLKALSKKREDRFENCKAFVRGMTQKPKKQPKASDVTLPENEVGESVAKNARPLVPSLPSINLKSERADGGDSVWKPQALTGSTKSGKPTGAKKKPWLIPAIATAFAVVALGGMFLFSGGGKPKGGTDVKTNRARQTDTVSKKDTRDRGTETTSAAFEWQSGTDDGQSEIDTFCKEFGSDVKATDDKGETLLHKAAWRGNIAAVKFLVSQGAEIRVKDKEGNTPFHRASHGGHVTIMEFLIAKGADIHAKCQYGWTPLHQAALMGRTEAVKFLVSKGAEIHAQDREGNTPVHYAVLQGHKETVRFFVSKGANVNIRNNGNTTPLHQAAYQGFTEIARFLVSQGADINAKDNNGWTPLDTAKKSGKTEIAEYLASVGGAAGQ